MQQDNLERFIQVNREAFDDATPGLKAWSEIDRALGQKQARRINLRRTMSIAAAVLLLLIAGGVIGNFLTRSLVGQTGPTAAVEKIAPGFSEMEQFYNQQLNQMYAQLANYPDTDGVKADLAQIDQAMEELKADLATAPKGTEEQIVHDLIESYRLKIDILERVLERMESTNTSSDKIKRNEISI